MDVYLSRPVDGFVRLFLYSKGTRKDQYIYLSSFVPLKVRRNLIRCVVNKVRKIRNEDSIKQEPFCYRMFFGRTATLNYFLRKPWDSSKKDLRKQPWKRKPSTSVCPLRMAFQRMSFITDCLERSTERCTQQKSKSYLHQSHACSDN